MLNFVVIFIAVYAGMLVLLYFFQRGLMYHPSKTAFRSAELTALGFEIATLKTSDGLTLKSLYRPARSGRATILYFHGNAGHAGHRVSKARPFYDAGYGVFLLSYRGYGPNPGNITENGLYRDGTAAFEFLKAKGIGQEQIILYGESLGAGIAVELARGRKFAAIVLESPFNSIAKVAQSQFPIFPVKFLVKDRFESETKITAIEAPLLALHGKRDRTVPIRFGRALFDLAPDPKKFIEYERAGHNDLYQHGAAGDILAHLESLKQNP